MIEIKERLTKMFDFYNEFSRIFPNYTILEQSKYIYKNIQKKQKVLDNLEEEEEKAIKKKFNLKTIKKIQIIDTENYESIMKVNITNESFIEKNIDINNSKESKNSKKMLDKSYISNDNSVDSLIGLERIINDIEDVENKLLFKYNKIKDNFKHAIEIKASKLGIDHNDNEHNYNYKTISKGLYRDKDYNNSILIGGSSSDIKNCYRTIDVVSYSDAAKIKQQLKISDVTKNILSSKKHSGINDYNNANNANKIDISESVSREKSRIQTQKEKFKKNGLSIKSNLNSNINSNFNSNFNSNINSNINSNFNSNFNSNINSNFNSNINTNIGSNIVSNNNSGHNTIRHYNRSNNQSRQSKSNERDIVVSQLNQSKIKFSTIDNTKKKQLPIKNFINSNLGIPTINQSGNPTRNQSGNQSGNPTRNQSGNQLGNQSGNPSGNFGISNSFQRNSSNNISVNNANNSTSMPKYIKANIYNNINIINNCHENIEIGTLKNNIIKLNNEQLNSLKMKENITKIFNELANKKQSKEIKQCEEVHQVNIKGSVKKEVKSGNSFNKGLFTSKIVILL